MKNESLKQNNNNSSLTVSELVDNIKRKLQLNFSNVIVEGEISGFFQHMSSGHIYFDLKDEEALIRIVFFQHKNRFIKFQLQDGMLVRVQGNISTYKQKSQYQINCEMIEQAGIGDLLKLIEDRKIKLAKEGLFDETLKKQIPIFPKKIVIITSPSGAAIRDVCHVLNRRNPGIDIRILPTLVQGTGTTSQIINQILTANKWELGEVIILTRGGGSIEDLIAFSDEKVIRAIAASKIPIISAIGHEIDHTLSDLAADKRAPTPSTAGEMVAIARTDLKSRVLESKRALERSITDHIQTIRHANERFRPENLERSVLELIQPFQQRFDDAIVTLNSSFAENLKDIKHQVELAIQKLKTASPLAILERGYAVITEVPTGNYITSLDAVSVEQNIRIKLYKDSFEAKVTKLEVENNDI